MGTVEHLFTNIPVNRRLQRGLALLRDYREGRLPSVAKLVASQRAGDTTKIAIEGDELYLIVQCYRTRPRAQGRYEAHQRYTDVQYICEGQEWIETCDLRAQLGGQIPAYNAKGDLFFVLGSEAQAGALLHAGEGVVLFPNDAHAPCLRANGDVGELVRKIVVKIRDAHLPDAGSDGTYVPNDAATVETALAFGKK
jgi:YhcH/YjgK/YiaL family protein